MKTHVHLSLITLSLVAAYACFPEADIVWDEDPNAGAEGSGNGGNEMPTAEELEPFGATVGASLTAGTQRNPVADCAPSSPGLASEMAGVTPGGRLGVGNPEINQAGRPDAPFLQDEFRLSVASIARDRPLSAPCVESALAGEVVNAAAGDGASAGALIRQAADTSGQSAWVSSGGADRGDLKTALFAICARFVPEALVDFETGATLAPDVSDLTCGPGEGDLPADLEEALTPVVWAIHDGIVARTEMDAALEVRTGDFWRAHGGKSLLASNDNEGFNAGFDEDRTFLASDRGKLYGAAAAIADAVQAVDWSLFEGRTGVSYTFVTPAGQLAIRDADPTVYREDEPETLLLVDLGGDDEHYDEVASNRSGRNAVSIVVDVGGRDSYGYPESANANLDGTRLPRDVDGAIDIAGRFAGISASERARQGAARNGIAMLFDLGGSEDRYVALRASQGYAHQGVGLLFDDGGRDIYVAEMASQGAAQFGLGLLVDLGTADDERRSSHASQGYGYVAGVGLLYDEGGNDSYDCDPDGNGNPSFVAPQMPGEANASMCQGAGQGFRIKDETFSLAGGVGLLVDADGDDTYRGGVYAQGVGYWQGFGMLADRAGADVYDAYYYAQGAAAHFGVGYLADGGPEGDRFQSSLEPRNFVLGAAQDFSVAVVINEGGDDVYELPDRGASVASCGSVSVFVDNGGQDSYLAAAGSVAGVANGEACGENVGYVGTAVFLDVGGTDIWQVQNPAVGNDQDWQQVFGPAGTARAFSQDIAQGDSGLHVDGR